MLRLAWTPIVFMAAALVMGCADGGSNTPTGTGGTDGSGGAGGNGGAGGAGGSGGGGGTGGAGGAPGLFAPPASYLTTEGDHMPSAIAGGDVDDDGHLDLVTLDGMGLMSLGFTVSALRGAGDGTFTPRVVSGAGMFQLNAFTLADFDGDEKADVAAARLDGMGHVMVMRSLGDGTFEPWEQAPLHSVPGGPQRPLARDFDADGDMDLAVPNQAGTGIRVLLNKGDGTFADAVEYGTGTTLAAAAADFNGDGALDLAIANQVEIGVMLGKGDGTFGAMAAVTAGEVPVDVAVGDLDGNGQPDLVVSNRQSLDVSVLLGKGDGTFAAPTHHVSGKNPTGLGLADFDGDGKLDVAVTNTDFSEIALFLGKGDGSLEAPVKLQPGMAPHGLVVGDFNQDGKPDLATTSAVDRDVKVLINQAP
ncbi:VCBS repeat-containing protein [Polyangium sp. 15x6]|uniref:FG-GAP repeat domain-containing protein n=1 Tax=Polyangium sp. 15x6 TaxID=3042687 RepID=UPI00249A028B|nr:VCBS repeat-containing protein [Polyangium sp. 15x6]MDI3281816.1 VCBS repeat-containing protein [Polyangium sp. 15x6]